MRKLGELLIAGGWLGKKQLAEALHHHQLVRGRLGTSLLELQLVSEDILLGVLAEQHGMPQASATDLRTLPEKLIRMLPSRLAVRARAVPFATGPAAISVAMMDVQNLLLQDELSFVLGQKIQPHVALEVRILEALDKAFGLDVDERFYRIWDRLNRAQYLWSRTPNPEPQGQDLDRPLDPLPDPGLQAMTSLARSLEPALVQPGQGPRDLSELEARLSTLPDRDDVARAVTGFLSRRFHRVLLFRVSRGQVAGWLASGRDVDAAALKEFRLGFEQPSLFVNLKEGTDHYRGPLLPMPSHRAMARIWGGSMPRECLLLPIRVRGRMVTIIYADRRNEGLGNLDMTELHRLAAKAGLAFELCIMRAKIREN